MAESCCHFTVSPLREGPLVQFAEQVVGRVDLGYALSSEVDGAPSKAGVLVAKVYGSGTATGGEHGGGDA